MDKITQITRKEIFSLLANGYDDTTSWGESRHVFFNYYGTLSCTEFLARLYNLENLPSLDSRLKNAAEDISLHF